MRMLVETFVIFVLMIFIFFVSIEYIFMNQEMIQARKFHSACIDNLENSGFQASEIIKWREKANNLGIGLVVEGVEGVERKSPCYYIKVSYVTGIALLGVEQEGVIQGYAR